MSEGTTIYETVPFCGAKKLPPRIGSHLYEKHWEQVVELASRRAENPDRD